MKYLFDNNFSPKLVRMLRALDVRACALRECFPANVDDKEYLSQLAGTGWILLTCDRHIRTRKAEARALRESGVSALFFNPFFTKKELWDQAHWLVKNWPRIEAHCRAAVPGSYAEVRERGQIRYITL